MKYKEIVSVTGEAGLFQLVSSKSDGAIVRSLDGKNTKFIPSRNHNFTPLESIEVFTSGENVMLADVFKAMKENESVHPVPGTNADNKVVKDYFQQIFPTLDEDRVYQSDMKKMLKWYPQLKNADLLKFEEEQVEEEKTEEPEETVPKEAVEEPKKKIKNKEEQPVKAKETETSTKKEDTKKKASAAKDKTSDTKEKASSKKTKK